MERYLLGFQAVRVALSVILFVVEPRNFVGYLPEVRVVKVAEGLLDYLSALCAIFPTSWSGAAFITCVM